MRKNRTVANLLCLMAALFVSFSELVHPLLHGHHDAHHKPAVPQSISNGGNGWLIDGQSGDLNFIETEDFCPICAGLLSCEPAENAPDVPDLRATFTFVHGGSVHQSPFIPFAFSRGPPEESLF